MTSSLSKEYNLCYTTVERKQIVPDESGAEPMADVPDASLPRGILPQVLKTILAKRKAVKALIKTEHDPAKLVDYDIRQLALKLTANSMYGCLGFTASRFYAKPIAALITAKGREILQKTCDLATESLNLVGGNYARRNRPGRAPGNNRAGAGAGVSAALFRRYRLIVSNPNPNTNPPLTCTRLLLDVLTRHRMLSTGTRTPS